MALTRSAIKRRKQQGGTGTGGGHHQHTAQPHTKVGGRGEGRWRSTAVGVHVAFLPRDMCLQVNPLTGPYTDVRLLMLAATQAEHWRELYDAATGRLVACRCAAVLLRSRVEWLQALALSQRLRPICDISLLLCWTCCAPQGGSNPARLAAVCRPAGAPAGAFPHTPW